MHSLKLLHNTRVVGRQAMGAVRGMAKEAAEKSRGTNVKHIARTTYAALSARLDLSFASEDTMKQVCTHRSYEQGRLASNERMQWVGKRVLNLYVGEYLAAKYPNLPVEVLQDVQHANYGLTNLAEIGRHFGMGPAMRWESVEREAPQVGLTKVLGKAVQALVGAVYQEQGAAAARRFVHAHVLSRPVDVEAVMQIKRPKLTLLHLARKKNLERPVARIMKETGRFTSSPVFVVGVFSGTRMLGMGFGSSLKMAEHRAAKDALLKHYTKEIKDIELPAIEEKDEADLSFFSSGEQPPAQPSAA
ncbi:54S ribosomal protein L3 mitochondrial [Coemansia sp. RSA 552]|nr:54S ribosomal protein L3 mitochondrial [Coemansia sp. RSA 552]